MKKKLMLLAVLGMFAVSPAFADKGDKWIGLNLGVSGPLGDFSDYADMGWQGTATGTFMLTPVLGLGADLGYHSWSGSDDYDAFLQFITGDPGAEGSFNTIQATAHATFMIPMQGKARPYLQGGLGLYNFKAKFESSLGDDDDSESDLGYNLGGGVNFLASPMYQIGIGAAYHKIQLSDDYEGVGGEFYTVGLNLLWGKSGGQ